MKRVVLTLLTFGLLFSSTSCYEGNAEAWRRPLRTRGTGSCPGSVCSGLAGWWRADAGVSLSGAVVLQWNDLSGHSRNWTNGNAKQTINQITNAQNGLPVIRQTAQGANVAGYLTTPPFFSGTTQPGEAILVMKSNVTGATNYAWNGWAGDGTNSNHYAFSGSQIYESFGCTARFGPSANASAIIGSYHIYDVVANGISMTVNVNGTQWISTATCSPKWNTTEFTLFVYRYSSGANPSFTWLGDIGELIVYDHKLSASDQTAVYNYLKSRWGITG